MHRFWVAAAMVGAVFGAPKSGQTDAGLQVAAVRFQRSGGSTLIEGMVSVPFAAVSRLEGDEASGFGAYRVTMVVRDTSGLVLTRQQWSQRVPARLLRVAGGSAVELFRFAAQPGEYRVEVAVADSASGRVTHGQVAFSAFADSPRASDLLLSPSIRAASGPDDTVAAGGELRHAGLFITAQPEPVLTPSSTGLYYYVELYSEAATTVAVSARILAQDGREVIARAPEDVQVAAGGGIAASGLNLTGLPEGQYQLELVLGFGDTTVTRRAGFRMAGFGTQQEATAVAEGGSEDLFGRLAEDQLDSLYRPLVYILEGNERGVYEDLSLEGKRNFLRRFWARRDPTPGTVANEAQRSYYNAIATADREFAEGGAASVPGWRTDRGRVYLRYGPPDEVLKRPQAGATQPYEVWKYTRSRNRKFVFLDRTGLGNYQLIYTDERREPSLPNWESLLGTEAAEDVRRF